MVSDKEPIGMDLFFLILPLCILCNQWVHGTTEIPEAFSTNSPTKIFLNQTETKANVLLQSPSFMGLSDTFTISSSDHSINLKSIPSLPTESTGYQKTKVNDASAYHSSLNLLLETQTTPILSIWPKEDGITSSAKTSVTEMSANSESVSVKLGTSKSFTFSFGEHLKTSYSDQIQVTKTFPPEFYMTSVTGSDYSFDSKIVYTSHNAPGQESSGTTMTEDNWHHFVGSSLETSELSDKYLTFEIPQHSSLSLDEMIFTEKSHLFSYRTSAVHQLDVASSYHQDDFNMVKSDTRTVEGSMSLKLFPTKTMSSVMSSKSYGISHQSLSIHEIQLTKFIDATLATSSVQDTSLFLMPLFSSSQGISSSLSHLLLLPSFIPSFSPLQEISSSFTPSSLPLQEISSSHTFSLSLSQISSYSPSFFSFQETSTLTPPSTSLTNLGSQGIYTSFSRTLLSSFSTFSNYLPNDFPSVNVSHSLNGVRSNTDYSLEYSTVAISKQHTNISFEIKFTGECDPLLQRKLILEKFWQELVIVLAFKLKINRHNIKPKDIACNPIRLSLMMVDIDATNMALRMEEVVIRDQLKLRIPIPTEDTTRHFDYKAVEIKVVPLDYDILVSPELYDLGLSEVDIVVIIVASCISFILVIIGCCICAREYYIRRRTNKFDVSNISSLNTNLEDYTLTKIPRPKAYYGVDNGIKMRSFTRKDGIQTQALLDQEENESTPSRIAKDFRICMKEHEDGIVIGVTTISEKHAEDSCHANIKESKQKLCGKNPSPAHCMDNPIYYADEDENPSV